MNFNNKTSRQIAIELGHINGSLLDEYDSLKKARLPFDNEHVAELDIIYFLRNILWSGNFELVASIIKDYGMQGRLKQWQEALDQLNSANTSVDSKTEVKDFWDTKHH